MVKLNPKNYVWEWERNAFLYYFYLFADVWLHNKFLPPLQTLFLFENGVTNAYFNIKSLNQTAPQIITRLKNNPQYSRLWQKYSRETGHKLHQFCDQLQKVNWSEIDNQQLLELFKKAIEIYSRHTENVGNIRNFNRAANSILQKSFSPLEMAILLATDKKSLFTHEHEDLLKIADQVRKHHLGLAEKNRLLKQHTDQYFYLPCGYYQEKTLTISDFRKELATLIKKGETWQQFQTKLKHLAQERKLLIKKLHPTSFNQKIIDFGSICTYFKDFIRGNLNRLSYYNILIFKEIARRTGNNWLAIASLLPPEVETVLRDQKKVKLDNKLVLYSDRTGIHRIKGVLAEKTIMAFKKYSLSQSLKEITGTTANPGLVRGRVLILHHAADVRNNTNYILVTSMTTPDLMPAIQRSLAIVTDEGGLTCHAAIVARELGKPCIIGTKNATKILKNGDLVEVDATKGRVVVIK